MVKILEMFKSLQGEGPLVGTPSTFIRFSKCVLNCKWCDTKRAWKDDGFTIKDNLTKIEDYIWKDLPKTNIVLTGGEPLRIENLEDESFIELMKRIVQNNSFIENITIETTGISDVNDIINPNKTILDTINHFLNAIDYWNENGFIQFSISPKFDLSSYPIKVTQEDILRYYTFQSIYPEDYAYWFKFVYMDNNDDMEENILLFIDNLVHFEFSPDVYIMPYTAIPYDKEQYENTSIACAKFCLDYNLTMADRLHIRLWGMKDGV